MSRSGYSDDFDDPLQIGRWRGAVASALRGKRGQAFLREMLAAMDALPERALVAKELEQSGGVCAIGSVGKARGIAMGDIDPEDNEKIAEVFGIPHTMACEIMDENDGHSNWDAELRRSVPETPEQRFRRMRGWIERHLIEWEAASNKP